MTTLSLFANRATAKLAVAVASNDTALTLVPGGGAWFPAPAAGQFFRLVLQVGTAQTDQREYMICTSRAGDVLTVTRAQEGTPAGTFNIGDEVSLVITSATSTSFVQRANNTLQGALEVEAPPTTALGIATKDYVDTGRLVDAPADGKDYARKDTAWHALGAAAGLAVPIPITAGGTGAATLPAAQTNLVIGLTTIDDLAPATPKYGDRWIKPSNMTEMVWVPNAGGGGAGVWINPADAASEAYPIVVAKGGTGATTAPQALTNLGGTAVGTGVFTAATQAAARTVLGIDYTATPFKLMDGTAAAPGLAWNSEPGLGWFRSAAGTIATTMGNAMTSQMGAASGVTNYYLYPSAAGTSQLVLNNQPAGSANNNAVAFGCGPSGYSLLEVLSGTATGRPLIMDFPAGIAIRPNSSNAVLSLEHVAQASASDIYGAYAGKYQWLMRLGAGSAANDFTIWRYNDAGALVASPMSIRRSDGLVTFSETAGVLVSSGGLNAVGGVTAGANGILNSGPITTMDVTITPSSASGIEYATVRTTVQGMTQYLQFRHQPAVFARAELWVGPSGYFYFDNGGNASKSSGAGQWNAVSDARVKHVYEDYAAGLAEVLQIVPKWYAYKDAPDVRRVSPIAQDIRSVLPETITAGLVERGDIRLEDGLTFDPTNVQWALVNAIKTLHARVQQLEKV